MEDDFERFRFFQNRDVPAASWSLLLLMFYSMRCLLWMRLIRLREISSRTYISACL